MLEVSIIQTCPRVFLELAESLFINLKDYPALRRLFCYIVHSQLKNEQGYAVLSNKILAHIQGKDKAYENRNYRGSYILEQFSRLITPIEFKTYENGELYSFTKGKAREGRIEIPQQLINSYNFGGERVYIESKRKFKRTSSVARTKLQKERRKLTKDLKPLNNKQSELLDYLNNLPSNRFSHVKKHMEEAKVKCQEIKNDIGRNRALNQLEIIKDSPQPFYFPSSKGKTQRVFGNSYFTLPKKIRNTLCQDWFEIDLEQIQFRILAYWWGVEEVIEFLNEGKSLWKELEKYLEPIIGSNLDEYDKEILKKANKSFVYSVCYGMGRRNLRVSYRSSFEEHFGNKVKKNIPLYKTCRNGKKRRFSIGEYLMAHPLISSFLKQRQKQIKKVNEQGGAKSPYGFVRLTPYTSATSVLATVAQAWEQFLMEPIVNLSKSEVKVDSRGKKSARFQILGYIHDGVIVHFQDKSRVKTYLNKLTKAFEERASQIGMEFSYSIKNLKNNKEHIIDVKTKVSSSRSA